MPATVVGAGDAVVNKTDKKNLPFWNINYEEEPINKTSNLKI